MKKEKVYNTFKSLNINFYTINHPAIYSSDDMDKNNITFEDNIINCKNLFLTNKNKSNFYLVSLPLEKRVDLKSLANTLNESRLSFGNEELLQEKLNIKSGSVSILNIMGVEKTDVKFIIDISILDKSNVGFHPNDNTVTIIFSPMDIEKVLNYYNCKYEFINLK